jgi:hypothetical protein
MGTPTHLWWTGPGPDDCIEIHFNETEVTIWQYRHGDISSVTANRQTAEEIANYLKAIL